MLKELKFLNQQTMFIKSYAKLSNCFQLNFQSVLSSLTRTNKFSCSTKFYNLHSLNGRAMNKVKRLYRQPGQHAAIVQVSSDNCRLAIILVTFNICQMRLTQTFYVTRFSVNLLRIHLIFMVRLLCSFCALLNSIYLPTHFCCCCIYIGIAETIQPLPASSQCIKEHESSQIDI